MRIAVDFRALISEGKISGVENYLINNFKHLEHSPENEFMPFYNGMRTVAPVDGFHFENIRHSRIPNKIFNLCLRFLGMPKFENLYGDFDALWLPDLRPFAIKNKTKLVLTVHDLSPVVYPEFYSFKRKIWHWLLNYKKSFQRADLILAVSEYTKFDLQKIFKVPEQKIRVVHPGIDHKKFNTNLDQRINHKVRQKYNLPEKFVLSISTIEPRKNILGSIAAFEQVNDPGLHLVIAGRIGWLAGGTLKAIKNSKKSGQIKLIGYVPEDDKPSLISHAQAVLFPSFYEGFGFIPLEAMACGVPVIASARTSVPEVSGEAAILVEPGNPAEITAAINALLKDQELRHNLIRKGQEHALKFTWENSAKLISEYISQLGSK